jgi:D-sedoheptulose 7-phosphate isomerase
MPHEADLKALITTLTRFSHQLTEVEAVGQLLIESMRHGGKVLTCGNGGSAADALHLAEELVGRYRGDRPSLPAVCLSADVTVLTCIGNDYGFEAIFARAVESLGRTADVLVGISTSGNSENVLRALKVARAKGLSTVLLGGGDGGASAKLAETSILVPSENTARIQEVHTFVIHAWLEQIEAEDWT